MTLDTAIVSEGCAPEGTKGNRGRGAVARRANGRHEGETGGRRQSAGGMMGRWRRRVRNIKGGAKSWRKRKGGEGN